MIAKLILAGAAAALFSAGGASATTYDLAALEASGAKDPIAYGINDSR
jgi:hypothetical protein